MGDWLATIWRIWFDAVWNILWAAYYFISFNGDAARTEIEYFKGKIHTIYQMIWDVARKAYQDALDWASYWINNLLNTIGNVWGSITSIWSQFGAAFLDGYWTVVSWVDDKIGLVTWWVAARYDDFRDWASNAWAWVRDKSGEVWNWIRDRSGEVWAWIQEKSGNVWAWIRDKSGNVWDWIVTQGAAIDAWFDGRSEYYSTLFENFGNELLEFLEDPGKFIADRVADSIEYIVSEAITRFW